MIPSLLQQLNVELSPNMKQYVGLLELICSSSPIPTSDVLQDVSVLYARLGRTSLTLYLFPEPCLSTVCEI